MDYREENLLKKIEKLEEEIKKEKEKIVPTQKRGLVDYYAYNSDVGMDTFYDKVEGWVPMSSEEIEKAERRKELNLYSLESELKQARDELFLLQWNKPENVSKREEEEKVAKSEEQKQQLEEERVKHDERYDDLNKLVEYLELAGVYDKGLRALAKNLSKLRFAYKNTKSDYITEEIDLKFKERAFAGVIQTSKKEYKQIRKEVIRLSKEATRMAKKYKELYNLYRNACNIVEDIENILKFNPSRSEWPRLLYDYFTQKTGIHHDRVSYNEYRSVDAANVGYEYLDFYRDHDSKYNEDVRKHRI